MAEEPGNIRSMSLGEHLEELRRRVLISLIAVCGAMILCWFLFESVMVDFMKAPLDMVAGRDGNPFAFTNPLLNLLRGEVTPKMAELGDLNVLSIFEPVTVRFRVSLLTGAILASPIVIGQIWKFVGAGLYDNEKKYVRIYGTASLFLFLFGCAFSFFILFPIAVAVMLGDTRFGVVLRLEQYVSQAAFFTVGVGSMFEMPLVILFLNRIGLVDAATLREKRRHVILAILVVAAMITPPDPMTQVVVAIPMILLYEISILILRRYDGGQEED